MEVAGSGLKGEGAAAGAGRRWVFKNVAGAVSGECLKSPVSKVAGNGIFKMSQSQSPTAAPAIRGMIQTSLVHKNFTGDFLVKKFSKGILYKMNADQI